MKKRMGGILTALAAAFTTFSFVGCDLEVDNKDDRAAYIDTSTKTVTLTEAKTFAATETAGYTMKLGCDGSSMKVSSVKYNGTELMPDYTEYALSNLSFKGVNVSGLSADTWTVQYTYTMTSVGSDAWYDYNFEISDGDTTDGALGYWSVRYDNYAAGWLHGYHEYGTWTSEHIEGVTETDAAYGGHWYGMTSAMDSYDHTQTLNKTLVMTVKKTSSAFVITITSDGEQIWTCTNDSTSSASASESEETETIPTETDYVVGTEDCTTSWSAGPTYTIVSGDTQTVYFKNYSSGAANWNNFLVELWNSDNESAVTLRADNFGWNYGIANTEFAYETVSTTGTSLLDDWTTWLTAINGATVKLVVTYADGTITFTATSDDVAGWKQVYAFSGCTSSELYWHFNVDGSYLVVLK